jgi:3-hydroxyisobutyryl-CoA hydrolase
LFKGNGKSFCAGGDVVSELIYSSIKSTTGGAKWGVTNDTALAKQLGDPATWSKSSEFFKEEYATDSYIAKMKTPIVTIMHGNTRKPCSPDPSKY